MSPEHLKNFEWYGPHLAWLGYKVNFEPAKADLHGADLRGANLIGADLSCADLRGANLRGADLCGAKLRGADMWKANLRGAELSYANLSWADLRDANLRGAELRGADLRGADLRGAQIDGAGKPLKEEWVHRPTQYVDYDLETLPTLPFEIRDKKDRSSMALLHANKQAVYTSGHGSYSYDRLRANFTHADGSELGVQK